MKLVERDSGATRAAVLTVERQADGVLRAVTAGGEAYSRRALEAEGLELVAGNADEVAHLISVGWSKPRQTDGRLGPPGVSLECNCRDASQIERNGCPACTPRQRPW